MRKYLVILAAILIVCAVALVCIWQYRQSEQPPEPEYEVSLMETAVVCLDDKPQHQLMHSTPIGDKLVCIYKARTK